MMKPITYSSALIFTDIIGIILIVREIFLIVAFDCYIQPVNWP